MPSFPQIKGLDAFTARKLLRREVVERAVVVLKTALLALCVFLVWKLSRELVSNILDVNSTVQKLDNDTQTQLAKSAVASRPAGGVRKRDYDVIATRNLLGPLNAPQTAPNKTNAKPAAQVPLGLVGVFLTDGESPYAIIEDQKKNVQDVFNINDSVFDAAKLLAIFADHVDIERNGQREQLVLDDLTSPSAPGYKEGVAQVGDNMFYVQEAELDKALENLPLLLTQARAVPYFKDGRSVGLRLFAIKSDSLFEKIGLKNADILKSVNGNSLADLTQAIKLFETLKKERSLSLSLERANDEKEFKYEIR